MLRWNEAIIASRLGKEDALLPDTLFQTPPLSDGSDSNYAYGLKVSEYGGLPTIGHGGAFVGFRSGNLVFPEQGFSVVVLANLSGIEPSRFCERIADIYLEDQLQPKIRIKNTRTRKTKSAAQSNAAEPIRADNLQEFSATYSSDELNAAYRILNRDGELTVEILETRAVPEALEAVAPDSFRSSRSALSFSRDKEGNIVGFILNSGRVKGLRFDRQPKVGPKTQPTS
jgi:CubicO group peptidase (beta-lactamase class C family)